MLVERGRKTERKKEEETRKSFCYASFGLDLTSCKPDATRTAIRNFYFRFCELFTHAYFKSKHLNLTSSFVKYRPYSGLHNEHGG